MTFPNLHLNLSLGSFLGWLIFPFYVVYVFYTGNEKYYSYIVYYLSSKLMEHVFNNFLTSDSRIQRP